MAQEDNFGRMAENLVRDLYLQKDYKLIQQNFQYYNPGRQGRKGELDLIFVKDTTLIIVEVKARSNQFFGPAIAQISTRKLDLIRRTLDYFLLKNKTFLSYSKRFDVALMTPKKLEVIPNAWDFQTKI